MNCSRIGCNHAPLIDYWELIDVETLNVIRCDTPQGRDHYQRAFELAGHRVIVREIRKGEL